MLSSKPSRRGAGRCSLIVATLLCAEASSGVLAEDYTYRLSQSNASLTIWTAPPVARVFKDAAAPTAVDSQVRVYAARNETEPFQIVVHPASTGTVAVSIGAFGAGISTELYQVKYVPITVPSDNLGRTGDYPDPLAPLALPASIGMTAGQNTALWFTVRVARGTAAGDYTANVSIGGVTIPVRLHVFGFTVPDDLHVKSAMDVGRDDILDAYSAWADVFGYVERINQFMVEHRLTPSLPTWPGSPAQTNGAPLLTYDCSGTLTDNDGVWGFEIPAAKYLGGSGFNNGHGFPSFRVAGPPTGGGADDPRPPSFCGQSLLASDWVSGNNPNSPYNLEWREYVAGLRNYLDNLGYLDQAYWTLASEPQSQADYDALAWYSQLLKSAAPDLSLMVAEEPRPEIYAHPSYTGAKIDTWLAFLNNFNPSVSFDRDAVHGEATWLYFLPAAVTPRFNPITIDHPDVDAKVVPWFFWKFRVRGWSHYATNAWTHNPWTSPGEYGWNGELCLLYPPSETNAPIAYGSNGHRFAPSIRLELLRDGLEDYEYLYAIAGGAPQPGVPNAADTLVDRIVGGLTAYNRDGEYYYELRRQMGLYLGGETAVFPDALPPARHSRALGLPASFYINFQDPAGPPTADPLIVNGHTYMKIGWQPYSAALGYGWYGDFTWAGTGYRFGAPNDLQASYLYNGVGVQTFEFDMPNGIYDVTVSVGLAGGTYLHNKVVIEGVPFVSDEASNYFLVRTYPVTINDHKLTLEMGIPDEFTILDYLDVVVRDADADSLPDWYEVLHGCLDANIADAAADPDQDGLASTAEYGRGTNPCNGDSDEGGENDGSESAHGRNPLAAGDDLMLTIRVGRSGTTVALDWNHTLGSNAQIDGPYFVYRGSTLPLQATALVYGPLATGTEGTSDSAPPCNPCFYRVWNKRLH